MPELMIINPGRAKRKKSFANKSTNRRKKGRSAMPKKKTSRKRSTTGSTRGRKNPRRRRMTTRARAPRRRYTRKRSTRRRRYRRNPSGFELKLPVVGTINLVDVGGGTLGSILAKMLPNLAASKLGVPIPTTGFMKYPVQLVSGLAVSWALGDLLKQKGPAKYTALFTLNNILTDLANEYIVGPMGMSGFLGDYPFSVFPPMRKGLSGAVVTSDTPTVMFRPVEVARNYVVNDSPRAFRSKF